MNIWEFSTWLACAVLGPGALIVFWFFLRDARNIVKQLGEKNPEELSE